MSATGERGGVAIKSTPMSRLGNHGAVAGLVDAAERRQADVSVGTVFVLFLDYGELLKYGLGGFVAEYPLRGRKREA